MNLLTVPTVKLNSVPAGNPPTGFVYQATNVADAIAKSPVPLNLNVLKLAILKIRK